jgi:SNF2 family DNA or RNA helicase
LTKIAILSILDKTKAEEIIDLIEEDYEYYSYDDKLSNHAHKLNDEGRVSIKKVTNPSKFNCEVISRGKFKVKFSIDDHFDYCNCSKVQDCAHIYAAALHIKECLETYISTEDISDAKKIIPITKTKQVKEAIIAPPSGYQLLINNLNDNFQNRLNKLKDRFSRSAFEFKELEIVSESEINLKASSYYWSYIKESIYILLKVENNNLFIKCSTCNSSYSNKQCTHIGTILQEKFVMDEIINLCNKKLEYESHFQNIAEKEGVDIGELKEKFMLIKTSPSQIKVVSKNENFYIKENSLSKKSEDYKVISEQEYFDNMEINLLYGSAIHWDRSDSFAGFNGKLSKEGNKLASNYEAIVSKHYFNENQFILFTALLSNNSIYIEAYKEKLNLIHTNLDIFSSMIHYVNTSVGFELRKGSMTHAQIINKLINLKVDVKEEKGFTVFYFYLIIGDKTYLPSDVQWANTFIYMVKGGMAAVPQAVEMSILFRNINFKNTIEFFSKNTLEINRVIGNFSKYAEVNYHKLDKKFLIGGKRQLYIRQTGSFVIFEPILLYDNEKLSILNVEPIVNKGKAFYPDDSEVEQYKTFFKSLHPEWNLEIFSRTYVFLDLKKVSAQNWYISFFAKCFGEDLEIFGQEVISKLKYNFSKPSISKGLKSGINWFEVKVDIKFGDLTVAQKNWVEAISKNERYVKLDDGSVGLLPEEWIDDLRRLVRYADAMDKKDIKLSKLKFHLLEDLYGKIDDQKILDELQRKKLALANYDKEKAYPIPTQVDATLRPYQAIGYQWLKFLDEFEFGGCLADDMGLGKTLQMILFLQDQKNCSRGTSLVIVPKTLLFNWQVELNKFAPQLVYLIHHGLNRQKDTGIFKDYDVIITTYDTISRDIDMLKTISFNYIILDESQAIKNTSSIRYKATRLLESRNKLTMTGTPIENNSFDLYAQFSFVNPGLLGSEQSFGKNFAIPIDQNGDIEAAKALKKLIHPFILRRTKELVASDLPDKMESIIYCEMGDNQKKLYDALKKQIKQKIEEEIESNGLNQSKFLILEGLTKLRQLCNSPQLLYKNDASADSSIKIETLISLLEEELGEHKALVYSQFVTMLALVKKELDKKGIKYAYLDGSTQDRGKAVGDFMDDDSCQVFLLSLKAGNAGLNLTKADYVYIIDPWWNPAVEAQAIDRTHRIGQSKSVFAYKMICKDTIEEKIIELQKKKKKLAGDLIDVDESVFKSLDKGELLALFD